MKRMLFIIVAIALIAALVIPGTLTHAAQQRVALSAGDSLSDALENVADGGTIEVSGTVAVTEALGIHGKSVTITGGTLNFTGFAGDICLGDHITFENIRLSFVEDASLFACGYEVEMGEGITMPNPIKIYGGKKNATVESTHLTLLSGTYSEIYGGGYNGNVIGDTNLYVGGNVNESVDVTSHDRLSVIYGGGYASWNNTVVIGGTANTVLTGSAKANYLYGGNCGSNMGSTIYGGTNLQVSGGRVMSVYGASGNGDYHGGAKLVISGGTMEQVFGGSEGGSVTGDVAVDITGGTITRRVYGGCYNNYDGSWTTNRYVNGKITLTLHSGANITLSSSDSDRSIYARSRHATVSATEVAHLVYADATAYSNYKNKLKAQDWSMQLIMGSVSAADQIHYHTYSAAGAVVTQSCIDGNCSASATLEVVGTPAYNGKAVEPAKVTYSGAWFGGELDIAYENNTSVGTATASVTRGNVTAALDFAIVEARMTMNGEGYAAVEDALAAARQTPGADTITLTQDVELSKGLVIDTEVTITASAAVKVSAGAAQGGMFRVINGGKLTLSGITLEAGENTDSVISNNGGTVELTNVELLGNGNSKGIFHYAGETTAKTVDIADMSDGIYVMEGTTVKVDNVTVSNSARYGIKVKGTLEITNTANDSHALSVSGSGDHAIDVENGGVITCGFTNASAVTLSPNGKKDLHVHSGGSAVIPGITE